MLQPKFDPVTGKLLDKEALKSTQFGYGKFPSKIVVDKERDVKIEQTRHSETGKADGFYTHHKDGRQDCTVNCPTVEASF